MNEMGGGLSSSKKIVEVRSNIKREEEKQSIGNPVSRRLYEEWNDWNTVIELWKWNDDPSMEIDSWSFDIWNINYSLFFSNRGKDIK
jgi:hypothetical protein